MKRHTLLDSNRTDLSKTSSLRVAMRDLQAIIRSHKQLPLDLLVVVQGLKKKLQSFLERAMSQIEP